MWQYFRDQSVVNGHGAIADFNEANPTKFFNFKANVTGQTGDNGRKEDEIIASLKYLGKFWRTLEVPLMNFEIRLILTWTDNCVIVSTVNTNQGATISITTKLYVPVVTSSTEGNAKLL